MAGKILFLVVAVAFATVSGKPGRIIDGEEARANEFPFIVEIQRVGTHFCSGTILTDEWIVTAAHCATARPADYTIVAGDHTLNVTEGSEQVRQVFRVVTHPLYDSPEAADFENDVALMQVLPGFTFNEQVQPAKFPSMGFLPTSASGVIAGWGATAEQGAGSPALLKATVPLISDTACDNAYGGDAVTASMICAGGEGADFCTGDSGGPLLCANATDADVVCGVMSWGLGCGRPGFPGVYTETSYFSEWFAEGILPIPEDNSTYVEQREGCGGSLVGSSGLIEYQLNDNYTANERCTWLIRANMRETIRLNLVDSEGLGEGAYLEITEVDFGSAKTGRRTIMDIEAGIAMVPGPLILVTLVSSTSNNGGSFSLLFQGLGEQGQSDLTLQHFYAGDVTGSYSYPMGGGQYGNDEFSTFVINPPTGEITLTWNRLNMEGSGGSCAYDVINIHTHTADGFNSVQSVCGTTAPAPVSSDGIILLIMKTDYSITGTGFQVSW